MNTSIKRILLSIFCVLLCFFIFLKLSLQSDTLLKNLEQFRKQERILKDLNIDERNINLLGENPNLILSPTKVSKDEDIPTRILPTNTPTYTPTPEQSSDVADIYLLKDSSAISNIINDNFLAQLEEDESFRGKDLKIKAYDINADALKISQILNIFSNLDKIRLFVSLSDSLASELLEKFQATQILFTLVPNPQNFDLKDNKNIAGIKTPYAYSSLPELVKNIFPNKKVGIFYDEDNIENNYHKEKTIEALTKSKIPYSLYDVKSSVDENKIKELKEKQDFDVALFITGNFFLNHLENVKSIMEKNLIPLIAFSEIELRKTDAIFSIGIDYDSLGKQLGKLALAVLNDDSSAKRKIEGTKLYNLVINKKQADKYNILIPENILKRANIVIE